ncbi:unnamed protein product, partial [Rotaria sp. Silwood1]
PVPLTKDLALAQVFKASRKNFSRHITELQTEVVGLILIKY